MSQLSINGSINNKNTDHMHHQPHTMTINLITLIIDTPLAP